VLSADAAGITADYWIPPPTLKAFAGTVLEFAGLVTPCPSPPCQGHELMPQLVAGREVALALTSTAIVAGLAVFSLVARRLRVTVLCLWLIVPFAIIFVLAVRRSLYLDRVFLDATFALYLLLAWAATRAGRGKAVGVLLALAVAAAGMANLQPIYAGGLNPDWKSAARDFARAYRPGQAVFFNPGVLGTLVRAYLPPGWKPTREVDLWSRSYLDVPGWQGRFPQVANPTKRQLQHIEAEIRNYQLAQVAAGERSVWLITFDYSGMNDTRRWFTVHGYQPLLSEEYGGDTRIELWSQSGPESLGPPVVPDSGFRRGWSLSGRVRRLADAVRTTGPASLTTAFAVRPGASYSVAVQYRGIPPSSKPAISATVLDAQGRILDVFPHTQWYDWPINDVWLSQPFGLVVPPGGTRVVLSLRSAWGTSEWRGVAVYRER
jgi:hypothetical protein